MRAVGVVGVYESLLNLLFEVAPPGESLAIL